jgi:hypothetical protein
MLLNSRPATAWIADRVLASRSERINLINEAENRFTGSRLRENTVDVFCSRSHAAVQEFRRGHVLEIQAEFASRGARQKCLSGSPWTVKKYSVPRRVVAPAFFRPQVCLHYLADLFFGFLYSADIGEALDGHIANDFDGLRSRLLTWTACSSEHHAPPPLPREEDPEERNDPSYGSEAKQENPYGGERFMVFCDP